MQKNIGWNSEALEMTVYELADLFQCRILRARLASPVIVSVPGCLIALLSVVHAF